MCRYFNCTSLCCNYYGTCPESYSSSRGSLYNKCETYYKDIPPVDMISEGVWVGVGAGSILLLVTLLSIICYCYRRKKALENLEQNAMSNTGGNYKAGILLTEQQISQGQVGMNQSMNAPSSYLIGQRPAAQPQIYNPYGQSMQNFGMPILQPTLSDSYGARS